MRRNGQTYSRNTAGKGVSISNFMLFFLPICCNNNRTRSGLSTIHSLVVLAHCHLDSSCAVWHILISRVSSVDSVSKFWRRGCFLSLTHFTSIVLTNSLYSLDWLTLHVLSWRMHLICVSIGRYVASRSGKSSPSNDCVIISWVYSVVIHGCVATLHLLLWAIWSYDLITSYDWLWTRYESSHWVRIDCNLWRGDRGGWIKWWSRDACHGGRCDGGSLDHPDQVPPGEWELIWIVYDLSKAIYYAITSIQGSIRLSLWLFPQARTLFSSMESSEAHNVSDIRWRNSLSRLSLSAHIKSSSPPYSQSLFSKLEPFTRTIVPHNPYIFAHMECIPYGSSLELGLWHPLLQLLCL